MKKLYTLLAASFVISGASGLAAATTSSSNPAIISGAPWFDQDRRPVSARGGGILKENGRFYFFGEFKQDHGNAFVGFSCYSSTHLANWRFESIALPSQPDGRLGPGRVGERPKVLKNPRTGEFVMFMHTDNSGYRDPAVGYATSSTVTGPYTFQGPLLFDGAPIKKWDMSAFQDDDGSGYLVTHSGNLYRLADDYRSVVAQVVSGIAQGHESPAIFKRDGLYYWLGSGLTGWERNDNNYYTARSLDGPWELRGHFAPEGSLTWNSQTTFVLPIIGERETTYVYMGDRWAHPRQNSSATYVWQPLRFAKDGSLSLPEYIQSWKIDLRSGAWSSAPLSGNVIDLYSHDTGRFSADWKRHTDAAGFSDLRSDVAGATLEIPFTGTQVALYSVARDDGGFAELKINNARGETVLSSIIETYCLYTEASLKFISPKLERGDYTLTVTVLGERFFWQAKNAAYGSKGQFVSVQKILVTE